MLSTPLVNANPANTFSSSGNQVYAIIPGYASGYAPFGPGAGAVPGIGQQITIPAGVPGLAAGTYTLLPARYALLPGAYRVELGKTETNGPTLRGAATTGNGSYVVDGYRGIANSGVKSALATMIIVTSGTAVRSYSQYNETNLSAFLLKTAAALGQVRPALPADAGNLSIALGSGPSVSFSFDGTGLFQPAAGGFGGSASIGGGSQMEIENGTPTPGFTGLSIDVAMLNALGANKLTLSNDSLFVRGDVRLSAAPEIALSTGTAGAGIVVEPGAVISTLGKGASTALSEVYSTNQALLVVSNGRVSFDGTLPGTGAITIGDGAKLLSEGSIGFDSTGAIAISDIAQLGTRVLGFSSASINIGEAGALAGAVVPAGLNLTPEKLARLLSGDPAAGIPGIQTLSLTASSSLNFFGTVDLSIVDAQTGKADAELVLNTPAIYGYGSATDVATLTLGTLVWNGLLTPGQFGAPTVSTPPGPVIAGGPGTGSGVLNIVADQIVFGLPDLAPVNLTVNRVTYGFSTVKLTAGQITSNNKNALAVYQSQGVNPGDPGIGGDLNLLTPLMTGAAGSVMGFTAGGTLTTAPGTVATTARSSAGLGAEIDLAANTISVGDTIMLPSGKLKISATGNITLQGTANLNVAGQSTALNDQTVYTWGGDVILQSVNGSITQNANAIINISAVNNVAGSVKVDAANGNVALNGQIFGSGTAGQNSGSFSVSGQGIGDFAALNAMLDTGSVFGSRSFDIKQGDLIVDGVVKAHSVGISVDNGSLTINGTIDASGNAPGTIRLAAKNDLTLASSGVLDAHGTVLHVDNYGAPVDAKNKGTIELTSSSGTLRLDDGSTMDVRVTDPRNVDKSGNQVVNYGEINLNASRTGETSGDINIRTGNTLNIRGAGSIAVNAFWTYSPTDGNGTIVQDNGDTTPVATSGADAGFVGLNQIDTQNRAFIAKAYDNNVAAGTLSAALQTKLAGLLAPKYASAFHLRPGVEIDGTPSTSNPTGKLTVASDLDLSGFRYGPNAAGHGAGEPGALLIRAAGNLAINGSITDGFAAPLASPDDFGWSLMAAGSVSTDLTLSSGAIVGPGSTFPANSVLGGDITILGATLPANTPAPVDVTLANPYVILAGQVYPATISTTVINMVTAKTFTVSSTIVTLPTPLVTSAAWVVPANVTVQAFKNGSSGPTMNYTAGRTVPTGATLKLVQFRRGSVTFPADVFPGGFPFPTVTTFQKGAIATSDTTFAAGTVLSAGTILPAAATINSSFSLQANVAIPVAVTLASGYAIPSSYTGAIATSTGTYTGGQTIPAGTVLPIGTVLPSTGAQITTMIWPAGDPLTFTSAVTILANATLAAGSTILANSNLVGLGGASFIAEAGHQVYAAAAMLPAGDLSWSMRLVLAPISRPPIREPCRRRLNWPVAAT